MDYSAHLDALDSDPVASVNSFGPFWFDPVLARTYLEKRPADQLVDGAVVSNMYTAISALLGPELVFLRVFRAALERWQAERSEWTWLVGHTLQNMLLRHDPHGWLGPVLDLQGSLTGENYLIHFLDQDLEISVPHPRDLRPIIAELARFLEVHQQTVDEQSSTWTDDSFNVRMPTLASFQDIPDCDADCEDAEQY